LGDQRVLPEPLLSEEGKATEAKEIREKALKLFFRKRAEMPVDMENSPALSALCGVGFQILVVRRDHQEITAGDTCELRNTPLKVIRKQVFQGISADDQVKALIPEG